MCGIAGFFGQRAINVDTRGRMLTALGSRGPDARGESLWNSDFSQAQGAASQALLHTRLSIRDLSPAGAQPMRNAAGDIWLAYNGEVYGWEATAAELKRRGHAFHGSSDTEFILRGYEAFGIEVLDHLRGMFALAILDLRQHRLWLARDRMGIKPLVYYRGDREFAFASTVRALLPYVPRSAREFSPDAIDAFLAHRYIPAPQTIYKDIARLPAGHYAQLDLETNVFELKRYWRPQARPHARGLTGAVEEAVALRTVADRPVGLFLSGGVDSATVASVLAAQGHNEIRAFTASFPGTTFDEAPQAQRIAAQLGLAHTTLPVEANIAADFDAIVASMDEPFADPSSFPLWYLARTATQHVKVILGGDGGDELFAGYKRYRKHLRHAWRGDWRLPLSFAPGGLPGKAAKWLDEIGARWWQAYALRFSGMAPSMRRYLQPDLQPVPPVYWQAPTQRGIDALLALDMAYYLPEYILRKADLCTMAHGLELRVPLLDHQLYEHVLSMPARARFTTPAKRALAPLCGVCEQFDLFNAPKRGFNPPIADWLASSLRPRLTGLGALLEHLTGGQLSGARCEALIGRFLNGRRQDAEQVLQLLLLATSLRQLRAVE